MDVTIKSKRRLFLKTKLASAYRQIVILNPDDVDAHVRLGDVCYELGKYEDAIAAYKKVIVLNPNDSLGHYNLAKVYLKIGNRDMAEKEYQILKTPDGKLEKELCDLIQQNQVKKG